MIEIRKTELTPGVRAMLEIGAARSCPGQSLDEMVQGCDLYAAYVDSALVAAWAVTDYCGTAEITLAGGVPCKVNVADLMDEFVSALGARGVSFWTQRDGLVRRAMQRGYSVRGFLLEKVSHGA